MTDEWIEARLARLERSAVRWRIAAVTMGAMLAGLAMGGGCGGATFKNQQEELAYLNALSNPTPEQWKRRQELRVDYKASEQVVREYLAKSAEDVEQGRTKDAISSVGIAVYTAKGYPDADFHKAAKEAHGRLKPLMDD